MRGQTLERGRHSPGHHAGSGDFALEGLLSRAVPHPSASMHNTLTQAMRLMVRLYIILMPRSLCVCVRLGVTFTHLYNKLLLIYASPFYNRSRILQANRRNFHHIFQKSKTFQPCSPCMDDHRFHCHPLSTLPYHKFFEPRSYILQTNNPGNPSSIPHEHFPSPYSYAGDASDDAPVYYPDT